MFLYKKKFFVAYKTYAKEAKKTKRHCYLFYIKNLITNVLFFKKEISSLGTILLLAACEQAKRTRHPLLTE